MDSDTPNRPSSNFTMSDPQTAALVKSLMLAKNRQLMAQQMMQQGQAMPNPYTQLQNAGPYAPGYVVRQSPLQGLNSALQQGLGAWNQQQAMDEQARLQGQIAGRNNQNSSSGT
jgi:hypothetical protein